MTMITSPGCFAALSPDVKLFVDVLTDMRERYSQAINWPVMMVSSPTTSKAAVVAAKPSAGHYQRRHDESFAVTLKSRSRLASPPRRLRSEQHPAAAHRPSRRQSLTAAMSSARSPSSAGVCPADLTMSGDIEQYFRLHPITFTMSEYTVLDSSWLQGKVQPEVQRLAKTHRLHYLRHDATGKVVACFTTQMGEDSPLAGDIAHVVEEMGFARVSPGSCYGSGAPAFLHSLLGNHRPSAVQNSRAVKFLSKGLHFFVHHQPATLPPHQQSPLASQPKTLSLIYDP